MQVTYPMVYPVIDAKKNYLNYNLFTHLDYQTINLPLRFYLELATKLEKRNDAIYADTSTSSPVGALFLPLFSIKMPYSFFILIIINILYAFFVKNPVVREGSFGEEPSMIPRTTDSYMTYNGNSDLTDIFPTGLDIYLVINSVFEKENPRGSTWFYYLLLNLKTVPSWVVPVLSLVLLMTNKISNKD